MVGLQGISTKTPGFPSKRRGFLRFPAADPGSHPFGESGNPCSRTPPNRPTHTRDRHLGGQVFPPPKKNCVSRRVVSNPFHSPLQCVAPGSHMGASENAGCNPLTNQCFQLFKSSDTPTYNPENSLETIGNQHVALVWPALSHNFLASTLIDPPVAHPPGSVTTSSQAAAGQSWGERLQQSRTWRPQFSSFSPSPSSSSSSSAAAAATTAG